MEEVKKQGTESLFVPYKIALELKKLGFGESCFGYYTVDEVLNFDSLKMFKGSDLITLTSQSDWTTLAPLWQQAARFLYINSNKQINITINGEDNYKRLCEKFKKAIEDFRNL